MIHFNWASGIAAIIGYAIGWFVFSVMDPRPTYCTKHKMYRIVHGYYDEEVCPKCWEEGSLFRKFDDEN